MRRIALRTRPAALFGAMLLIGLIVFLPMRLALGWFGVGEQGLTARRVSGSIWGATLSEARFGDLSLGDLSARLSPLPLFIGRARVALSGPDAAGVPPLRAAVTVSRHLLGVDDATGTFPTGRVFAPVPVTTLDLEDVTLRFRDGRCEAAEGRVRATLGAAAAGITLPPSVAGNVRCDRGALLLPLTSQAGTEAITLRVQDGGRYDAEFSVQSTDPLLRPRLEAAGFVATPNGYRLSVQGSL
ncbi:type II secretion system protein N [Sphingomonas lenta]|uniref:Type II secretion system protein N n=1 Tax=Sphingomonas lenta TaxID=1141887 RepID=A0A2A2SK73_9SPHN|nr:type II secretion system protein N [Sphingomonas lenta]PAX09677.1 type II secretion system protein N [Sphingomonas lenta]